MDTLPVKPRILVVEDDPGYQRLLEIYLRRLGCVCDCCNDGKKALQCVELNQYDILLVDIHIPELDGFMVACRLREMGYTMPLIAVSALKLEGIERKAVAVGFDDFLQKPIEEAQLERLLVHYTAKHPAVS